MKEEKLLTYDALINGFVLGYISTVPIYFNLYLDDASTAINPSPIALPVGTHKVQILAPLAARCKSPVIEFIGTTIQANDSIQIKFAHTYIQKIMAGDVLVQ